MKQSTQSAQRWFSPGLAVAFLAIGGASWAADEAWLKSVEAAYGRLDAKLHNFTVQGRFFSKDDLAGKPPGERKLIYTFEFSRLGELVRTVRKDDAANNGKIYMVANDSYFFSVGDGAPGKLRSLLDLGSRGEFKFGEFNRHPSLVRLFSDATGPLGNFGFPLEPPLAVLKHNAPRLKAQEVTLGGRQVLLLEGDFERFTEKTGMTDQDIKNYTLPNSRIYLDPAIDYRLVRWEFKVVKGNKTTVYTDTYEYENAVDGYPLISKYVMRAGNETSGYNTIEAEFSDWQINVNEPDEFRLSHYGFKEPDFADKPFLSGWLRLLLFGAVLVFVGAWLYRRSSTSAH